ncbi:cytochrome b/b6 domain-containing protein [Burkholderia gladioli]|uniref:cytochrome b/b6 domain-containing protein n=1 Tax=Burkholderia gladioli TaxID=28095 RepID=UPI0016403615|nr:cytochrome b/b6 domain-containing protein [Burkholderia gladioli]
MQIRDNGLAFSPITLVLHWLVAALLLAIVLLGLVRWQAIDASLQGELARWQNLLGLLLFLVSIYRLRQRLGAWHPLPVSTPNPVELIASRGVAVALALALAMVLLPLALWLTRAAAGEASVLPLPFAASAGVHAVLDWLLRIGVTAFFAGLALHVFGALKNHFVLRNDALRRMLGKHVEL